MEPVFIRVRRDDGAIATYPLSAFKCLEHSSRHHVYANMDGHLWAVAVCRNEDECIIVVDAILYRVALAVRAPLGQSLCPDVLDLSRIAAETLQDLREAWEFARLDKILEARERDRETGYDGVQSDHSDVECRGGDA